MKRNALGLSAVLLLMTASTLFAQDVRYNFDKNADFTKFKTYKWVDLKEAQKVSDLVDKQIKDTMDAELAAKGLTKTDADSADLYIGYQAAVGQVFARTVATHQLDLQVMQWVNVGKTVAHGAL